MPIIYLNGRFVDQLDASLDPLDRGVLLGDGLFETIRCEQGQLLFHSAHFARLARSARLLEIPLATSPTEMVEICHQVLDANNLETARLRITITRGESTGGPLIGAGNTAPTMIVNAMPIDMGPMHIARERGWAMQTATFPINHRSPISEIKSTSYQERLLARHFALRNGFDEALMLNTDGIVAEGAMTNLFIVRDGDVYTPPVQDGALPGIQRLRIGLICARLSIGYIEESLTTEDVYTADEAFLTNVIVEVMPLVGMDERRVGSGRPGEIMRRLYNAHREDIDQYLATAKGN